MVAARPRLLTWSVTQDAQFCLGMRAHWQPHREDRSFARFACHRHVAAHHARELARDGEAEPGAAEALSGRGIGLGKFFEHLRLLLRRHADAGVGDRQLNPITAVPDCPRPQLDLALLGELAGVALQVEQDLSHPHRVHGYLIELLWGLNN
jgi:hypothetical protein